MISCLYTGLSYLFDIEFLLSNLGFRSKLKSADRIMVSFSNGVHFVTAVRFSTVFS